MTVCEAEGCRFDPRLYADLSSRISHFTLAGLPAAFCFITTAAETQQSVRPSVCSHKPLRPLSANTGDVMQKDHWTFIRGLYWLVHILQLFQELYLKTIESWKENGNNLFWKKRKERRQMVSQVLPTLFQSYSTAMYKYHWQYLSSFSVAMARWQSNVYVELQVQTKSSRLSFVI